MLRFLVGEIALAPDLSQSQRSKVFRRIPVLRLLLPGFFVQHPLYHAAVFGAAYALLPTGTVVAVLPCCLISFLMPVLVVAGVCQRFPLWTDIGIFFRMSDREISERMNVVRQTISKRRLVTLKELRKYLIKEGFEWPDE